MAIPNVNGQRQAKSGLEWTIHALGAAARWSVADQSIIDALFGGPSWLERANQERLKAQAAYLQGGGLSGMMSATPELQNIAGGFGGTTTPFKSIMIPRIKSSAPPFEALVNPSRSEVRKLVNNYKGDDAVRHVTDLDGNHYVWDANYGTHYDFYEGMSALGEGRNFLGPQDTTYSFKDVPLRKNLPQ